MNFTTTLKDDAVDLILDVAAAARRGRPRVLLVGCPGSGKTALARRIAARIPRPTRAELVDLGWLYLGARLPGRAFAAPFRAPHHTCSPAAMAGGGVPARPGEVSLAHGGTLFLDELPEWRRSTVDVVLAALAGGEVTLARGGQRVTLPAAPRCIVASMNPCPCGHRGSRRRSCGCPDASVERFLARVTTPAFRFDWVVDMKMPAAEARDMIESIAVRSN